MTQMKKTKMSTKFKVLSIYEKFGGIQIKRISNKHTETNYPNIYLYQGFRISDGTAHIVYVDSSTIYLGHLKIVTNTSEDAELLLNMILDICL